MAKGCYIGVENFEKRNLPSGYTQVEYIESTGTQHIDTGFKANNNTRVVMDFEFPSSPTAHSALFGARDSSSVGNYVFLWHTSGYFRSDYNSSTTQQWSKTVTGRRTVDKDKETTVLDGSPQSYTNATFSCSYNLYLFARNSAGTADCKATAKIYSCQIYDNGTLVRDFVPCKNASNVIGLYDTVNGVFYENKGTGTFVAGKVYSSVARKVKKGYIGVEEIKTETVEYTTPGTYSVTVPNWAEFAEITACGGGGGGGAGWIHSYDAQYGTFPSGSGGGGGAAIQNTVYAITGGSTLSITVGAGGVGGHYSTNGGDGGDTIIGSIVTLKGGSGGKSATKSNGSSVSGVLAGGAAGGAGGGAGGTGGNTGSNGSAGISAGGTKGVDRVTSDKTLVGAGGGGGSLGVGGNGTGNNLSVTSGYILGTSGTLGGGGGGNAAGISTGTNNIDGYAGGDGYVKIVFKANPNTENAKKGIARKIKKAYIGVGGVARPCWSGGELVYYGEITPLTSNRTNAIGASAKNYALFAGGDSSSYPYYSSAVDAYTSDLSKITAESVGMVRTGMGGASVGNYAIFAGGQEPEYLTSTYAVDFYDNDLTHTHDGSKLSQSITGATGVSTPTHAMFGGGNTSYEGTLTYVHTFDADLTYRRINGLSYGTYQIAGASVGVYGLFAAGNQGNASYNQVNAIDDGLTKTNATVLSPTRQYVCGANTTTHALFAGGQVYNSNYVDTVDAYDKNLTRTTAGKLSVARKVTVGASFGEFALFDGGSSGSGTQYIMDIYDTSLTRTKTLTRQNLATSTAKVGKYVLFNASKVMDAFTVA